MEVVVIRCLLVTLLVLSSGCAPTTLSRLQTQAPSGEAESIWRKSMSAHGAEAFAEVRDLNVRYAGEWSYLGPSFQKILADVEHRQGSEERLLISEQVISQSHTGPAGNKFVASSPTSSKVWLNSSPVTDDAIIQSSTLVAQVYRLFLLGPFYFQRSGVTWFSAPDGKVDERDTYSVAAVLRPGFGFSEEDRVLLSIDKENHLLLRVLLTLNGSPSTRGAEVDVTFKNFQRINGILWPTYFDERIRAPLRLHAHTWWLKGLDTNRGYRAEDITEGVFRGEAAAPAAELTKAR